MVNAELSDVSVHQKQRMSESQPSPSLLFVYGTLRPAYQRLPQSAKRVHPPDVLVNWTKWRSAATLNGYGLLMLDGYPGAVEMEASTVVGDVLDVSKMGDEEWQIVDDYEEVNDGEYCRQVGDNRFDPFYHRALEGHVNIEQLTARDSCLSPVL